MPKTNTKAGTSAKTVYSVSDFHHSLPPLYFLQLLTSHLDRKGLTFALIIEAKVLKQDRQGSKTEKQAYLKAIEGERAQFQKVMKQNPGKQMRHITPDATAEYIPAKILGKQYCDELDIKKEVAKKAAGVTTILVTPPFIRTANNEIATAVDEKLKKYDTVVIFVGLAHYLSLFSVKTPANIKVFLTGAPAQQDLFIHHAIQSLTSGYFLESEKNQPWMNIVEIDKETGKLTEGKTIDKALKAAMPIREADYPSKKYGLCSQVSFWAASAVTLATACAAVTASASI
jgi:hypothetical protein